MKNYSVLILVGSSSDLATMRAAEPYFAYFGIHAEFKVSSAHRNPGLTTELAQTARDNGYSAIICGAGMAAHLAGVCAARSDLPVIGVPISGGVADGLDALLSTVQMPRGVPVATLAVGKAGAINSAVLCARILSLNDSDMLARLIRFREAGCVLPE